MFSHFEQERKLRLPIEPLSSFSKEKTMIFRRDFKCKFEKSSQTREKIVLKMYELSIFGSSITDMGT